VGRCGGWCDILPDVHHPLLYVLYFILNQLYMVSYHNSTLFSYFGIIEQSPHDKQKESPYLGAKMK
jgi:hypothetical protein